MADETEDFDPQIDNRNIDINGMEIDNDLIVTPTNTSTPLSIKRRIEDNSSDSSQHTKASRTENNTQNAKTLTTNGKKSNQLIGFDVNNKGPYGVWIKKITMDDKELSAYKVGSILYKSYKNIIDIKRKNKYKVEVILKSREEANLLLTDNSLRQYNLEPFLPGFRKQRKGIAKRIPLDLSDEDIMAGCESEIEILEIKRLNMRNKQSTTDKDKWIPSQSILITFSGQIIPEKIFIFKVKTYIEPYVSKPMQCYNCFKFGHTSKTCRGKKLCSMCGELSHQEEACSNPTPCCANCKGNHKSFDSSCPIHKDYTRINIVMAYDNISFFEAKKLVLKENIQPPRKSKENFPGLRNHKITKYFSQVVKDSNNQPNNQNLTSVQTRNLPDQYLQDQPGYSGNLGTQSNDRITEDRNLNTYYNLNSMVNRSTAPLQSYTQRQQHSRQLPEQQQQLQKKGDGLDNIDDTLPITHTQTRTYNSRLLNITNTLASRLNHNDSDNNWANVDSNSKQYTKKKK